MKQLTGKWKWSKKRQAFIWKWKKRKVKAYSLFMRTDDVRTQNHINETD